MRHVIAAAVHTAKFHELAGSYTRISTEPKWPAGIPSRTGAHAVPFTSDGPTAARDPLLLYFTSGTIAKPKLVQHSHQKYSVGHLLNSAYVDRRESTDGFENPKPVKER